MSEFRKRLLTPVSYPLIALVIVFILVFSTSRILLAIPEEGSTSIALMLAAEILGVASIIAVGTSVKAAQKLLLVITGVALIAGGGAAASLGTRTIEKFGLDVTVAAQNVAFVQNHVVIPSDQEVEFKFANEDAGIPHNVDITKEKGNAGTSVAKSEVFPGVATRSFKVNVPAGNYFYVCDVHPNMQGTLEAKEGAEPEATAGGAPAGGAPAATPASSSPAAAPAASSSAKPAASAAPTEGTIIAKVETKFETTSLTLAANTTDTVHFENEQIGTPHNVNITSDEAGQQSLARGKVITGPARDEFSFDAPGPGTVYYRCDVHPAMKGKITLK